MLSVSLSDLLNDCWILCFSCRWLYQLYMCFVWVFMYVPIRIQAEWHPVQYYIKHNDIPLNSIYPMIRYETDENIWAFMRISKTNTNQTRILPFTHTLHPIHHSHRHIPKHYSPYRLRMDPMFLLLIRVQECIYVKYIS